MITPYTKYIMKRINFLPVIVLASFLFSGCSQVKIIVDYDKSTEFPNYKTYMFLPWRDINSELVNDFDKERFYSALENELNARGYTKVITDADLAVNILVIIEKGTAYTGYTNYYNYGGWGYNYPFGMGYSTVRYDSYDYLNGTLLVDIFDHKQKKLIWQGAAIGEVKENARNRENKINKVVSRIFWEYPVQKKK